MEQPLEEPTFGIWPDNVDAVELFQRVMTQWNYAGLGVPIGLRYEAVSLPLQIHVPRERWAEVMDDLQVMELAALAALRKQEG